MTLSIKEQIGITIVVLTIFSILVILCLTCSFSYEILKEDYKQKRLYFFDKYKQYIESCFYFQNFCLLQYEEILKRMQKQIWKFHQSVEIYNVESNFINDDTQVIENFIINSCGSESITKKKTTKDNDVLFFACYFNNGFQLIGRMCDPIIMTARNHYLSLSSLIVTHDIYDSFRMPGYDIPILSSPLIISVNTSSLFSFNFSRICDSMISILGGTDINYQIFNKYYEGKITNFLNYMIQILSFYFSNKIFFFDHMFNKVISEVIEIHDLQNTNDPILLKELAKELSGYLSSVDYATDKFSLISYLNKVYFYCETSIIDNFILFINERLSNFLDISFIPLYSQNNTVLSPEMCMLFLLKQAGYQMDKSEIQKLFSQIIKGNSTIKDCFLDKTIFDKQTKVTEVFDLNFNSFLDVNNAVNQGLIDNKYYPIYYVKYAYPSYNVLKDFLSDYLLLDQIDYYFFTSFKDPIEFSNNNLNNNRNCFFLIVMIILYGWTICLFINLLIFCKVITQIIEPIEKLQEAIESSSIKDESIFKYEYDEFINDLFVTCKELLSGQIDRNDNENGMNKFNILSIPKDKKKNIDKKMYNKKLIVNNDIINHLLSQQQNMNDFSKNIKVNEELETLTNLEQNNNKDKNDFLQYQDESMPFISTENNEKEKEKTSNNLNETKNNIFSQNNISNEKEEIYKKLYRISSYLFYYINKIEYNPIHLVNTITDESNKSKISKINSNHISENDSLNSKMKNQIKKDDNKEKGVLYENISINMINNKNMFYLWYMEAKKRKNKSFDYYIGNNYDELFIDDNNHQNNKENVKKSNLIKNSKRNW